MTLRSLLIIFVISVFISDISLSDDKTRSDKRTWAEPNESNPVSFAPYNLSSNPSIFTLELDPGFATDSYIIGPEIWTQISGSYDYKTNGEVNHYLQVDPANPLLLHAVDVIADLSEPIGTLTRRTQYAASADGGITWFNYGNVPEIRSGYPVLKLRSNGAAVIGSHSFINGVVNTNLHVDQFSQAGAFTQYNATAPFSIWPQIEVYNNGNIGVLSRPQHPAGSDFDTIFYQVWDGTVLGPKSIAYISTPPYQFTVGTNARYHLTSNGAGRVSMLINGTLEDDTLGNSKVWSRTSSDNGVTWGPLELVFTPFLENGDDTVAVAGGSDAIYKPNSNTWVYSVAATANKTFADGRLYLIRSDGMRSVITTVAAVGGTTEFAMAMSFVFTLDQPALAYSSDGLVLYCVYAVVKPDLGTSGYNSRDLYYQRSLDDGATWGAPIRITNTPLIDECYASVSIYNRGAGGNNYDLNFTYMKDPGVGPASFGGSAPASVNSLIYRKITEANVVGISNNQINLDDYKLLQNYPNPFNPSTTISYNLVKSGIVTLKVFDLLGREVSTLVNEFQQSGLKEVSFNASNLSSGLYFYSISTPGFTDIKKMMLIK